MGDSGSFCPLQSVEFSRVANTIRIQELLSSDPQGRVSCRGYE